MLKINEMIKYNLKLRMPIKASLVIIIMTVLFSVQFNCEAQQSDKSLETYLSLGKPSFQSVSPNESNYTIGIGQNYNLGRFFSFGLAADFAHVNNYLRDLNTQDNGDNRLLDIPAGNLIFTEYSEVDAFSLVTQINFHFFFIKSFLFVFGYIKNLLLFIITMLKFFFGYNFSC